MIKAMVFGSVLGPPVYGNPQCELASNCESALPLI